MTDGSPPAPAVTPHPPGGLGVGDLTVRHPGHATPILRRVCLRVRGGTAVGVVGGSGAGKSTLLHTVSGLVPWLRPASVTGAIEIDGEPVGDLDPGQRAHLLASCLDRPDAQLFLATPRHELAAARRLYAGGPFVERALGELELEPLLDRRTSELSSGERQRLALAVALAGCPRPVLLDEPTAHLDRAGVAGLLRLLEGVVHEGGSVLLAEQSGWRLAPAVASWYRLEGGALDGCPPPPQPRLPAPTREPRHEVVLRLRGVAVERGRTRLLEDVDLALHAGEVVLVSGANGAGKSTLAEVVARLRRPAAGRIEGGGSAALMLPAAELQLFAATVADEVAATGGREESTRVLRRHRLEHLAARAPWILSRGERQRLVHAALDLQRPPLMVVDEPAQGLDPGELLELVRLIHRRAERGRAYLVISHREELAAAAHRHLRIVDRRLVEVGGEGR